jgi:hypothetical protein
MMTTMVMMMMLLLLLLEHYRLQSVGVIHCANGRVSKAREVRVVVWVITTTTLLSLSLLLLLLLLEISTIMPLTRGVSFQQ